MSTDLENLTANFGLLKREFRDVHAVVSRLDTQVRRLVEPVAIHRPAGLVARYAACTLIALKAKRSPEAIATQHFAADRDLARLPWNFKGHIPSMILHPIIPSDRPPGLSIATRSAVHAVVKGKYSALLAVPIVWG